LGQTALARRSPVGHPGDEEEEAPVTNVGDLGRRVAERRRELGRSQGEVAERAGMNPTYLEMLESSPSPQVTRSALWRLAAALDTTVEALSGGGQLAPPGHGAPAVRPTLDTLTEQRCRELIAAGGVGRVVFDEPRGPVALPVNFKMLGGDVVFRTASSSWLDVAVENTAISFEVDHIDDALGEGWSVLLRGEAHTVADPDERHVVEDLHVTPWAGGERNVYVRLAPREITGRRIRRE